MTEPTRDQIEAAKLAAMAENPTTHARCEVAFQRKRAEWLRAKLAEVERERDEWKHAAMTHTAAKVRAWAERDARPEISREEVAAFIRSVEGGNPAAAVGCVMHALRAFATKPKDKNTP